jgi:hypothetical protein
MFGINTCSRFMHRADRPFDSNRQALLFFGEGTDMLNRLRNTMAVAILAPMLLSAVAAREPGWSYSRLPGEGDRAAAGCTTASDEGQFACLVVRCEDDFTVGIYVDTHLDDLGVGEWQIGVDKVEMIFTAVHTNSPYDAKLLGDTAWLLDGLKQGAVAYLLPSTFRIPDSGLIQLQGSLLEINSALSHCAPREPRPEPAAETSTN